METKDSIDGEISKIYKDLIQKNAENNINKAKLGLYLWHKPQQTKHILKMESINLNEDFKYVQEYFLNDFKTREVAHEKWDKLYCYLANTNLKNNFLDIIMHLLKNNDVSKHICNIYLLSLNRIDLAMQEEIAANHLELIKTDNIDLNFIILSAIKIKNHFINFLIENLTNKLIINENINFNRKINCCKLVSVLNPNENICNDIADFVSIIQDKFKYIDFECLTPILKSYYLEILRQNSILNAIKDNENIFSDMEFKINYINSILSINFILELSDIYPNILLSNYQEKIKEMIKINYEYQTKINNGNDKFEFYELDFFYQFIILSQYIEIIQMNIDTENYDSKIEEILKNIKLSLKNIQTIQSFISSLEYSFCLLFLKPEQQNQHSCTKVILEKILYSLRLAIEERKLRVNEKIEDEYWNSRYVKISKYINDAVWKIEIINKIIKPHIYNSTSLFQLKNCNYIKKLFSPHVSNKTSTSSDEDIENSVITKPVNFQRRKPRKRKIKVSEFSNADTSYFITDTINETCSLKMENSIGSSNIILKMLGSAENIAINCLNFDNIENVKEIIRVHNLSSCHVAEELRLVEDLANTKHKISEILEYDHTESNNCNQTVIEKIKRVAAVGLEATKLTNTIEQLLNRNRIEQCPKITEILNKHKKQSQFLNMFIEDTLNITFIVDLMISIVTRYEIGLIIFNSKNNYFSNDIMINSQQMLKTEYGYFQFIKQILDILNIFKSFRNENIGIRNFLTDECYPLEIKELTMKLKTEKTLELLLKPDTSDDDILENLKSRNNNKCNLFGRIHYFHKKGIKLLNFRSNNSTDSIESLLSINFESIIGDYIFNNNIAPLEIQKNVYEMNINLTHTIILNCLNEIKLIDTDKNVSSINHIKHFDITALTNNDNKIFEYIIDENPIVAFLLKEILYINDKRFEDIKQTKYFNNLLNLNSIHYLSNIFDENKTLTALNYDNIEINKLTAIITNFEPAMLILITENLKERNIYDDQELHQELYNNFIELFIRSNDINYKTIEIFTDINKKAELFIEYVLKIESYEFVERIISSLILDDKFEELNEKIKYDLFNWLNNIKVYKEISECLEVSWRDVLNISKESSNILVENLLNNKHFNLCLLWSEIHPLRNYPENYSNFMLNLSKSLKELDEFNSDLMKIIETLPKDLICKFYKKMLNKLKNLSIIKYIVEYLIKFDNENSNVYQQYEISIKMFEILSDYNINNLWLLFSRPIVVIEYLLMNSKFDILQKVIVSIEKLLFGDRCCKVCHLFQQNSVIDEEAYYNSCNDNVFGKFIDYNHGIGEITKECIDVILRIYASKSLDFRIIENQTSLQLLGQSNEQLSIDSLYDIYRMPKTPPKKEQWIRDDEATHCMCCKRAVFTMLTRRHHCRRCGRVVCHACSTHRRSIPDMYDNIKVRFCNDCAINTEISVSNEGESETNSNDTLKNNTVDWKLYGNLNRDNMVRSEFSYEFAPNIPFCISILSNHSKTSEYSKFLLHYCKKFKNSLRPLQPGLTNPEIDYILVAKIIHSLAFEAKLRNVLPECSVLIEHAEIILTIVKSGCESLLPLEPLNGFSLRKLRDSLVLAEKWDLALELSLKCGFPTNGVMAAWGISCLRAGCYDTAREKFSYCMTKITSEENINQLIAILLKNDKIEKIEHFRRTNKSPPLLDEILTILKSNLQSSMISCPTTKTSDQTYSIFHTKILPSNTKNSETAMHIMEKIKNLKITAQGNFGIKTKTNPNESKFYTESLYYAVAYGTHGDIVSYFAQHDQATLAIRYLLLQNVEPEIFVNELFLPYIKNGKVDDIITIMIKCDETFSIWKTYITHICRILESRKLYNCLYHLQLLLRDPVRASMTCVKFYTMGCLNFKQLQNNLYHLKNAKLHLQTELELCQWVDINDAHGSQKQQQMEESLLMKMDSRTLNNHITTILRQMEITKFLTECEENGIDTIDILNKIFTNLNGIPTLFDRNPEKIQLCVLILVCGKNIEEGFGLAYRVIQDFNLSSMRIYAITARYLAEYNRIDDIHNLISCIKTNDDFIESNYDEIISVSIQRAINKHGIKIGKTLDPLLNLITDNGVKIHCQIMCGQLKSAYLLAIKTNRVHDLRKIKRQAEITNQGYIIKLCDKKLGNLNM